MKNINLFRPFLKLILPAVLLSNLFMALSVSKPTLTILDFSGRSGRNNTAEIFQQNPNAINRAEFPGGSQALQNYLHDNFQVPKVAFKLKNKEVVIRAQMELQIGTDGTVSLLKFSELWVQPKDSAILQAVKTELMRFVAQMPRWKPASKNGQSVATTDTLSFIRSFAPNTTWEDYNSLKNKVRAGRENTPTAPDDLRTKDGKKVFTFVQKQAIFPGGDAALKAYINQNLPSLPALKQSAGGLVVLGIVVNEKGIAEDLLVLKPEGKTLNPGEVPSLLTNMPAWMPGKQNNKPVPVKYTLPVR